MKNNPTGKDPKWTYSDDFELSVAVYVLPHLWWSGAMYGRSLSSAYAKLGRRGNQMVSGVAETFYKHFLGSMFGMSFELALKALLISVDDPADHRSGFPKTHDLLDLTRFSGQFTFWGERPCYGRNWIVATTADARRPLLKAGGRRAVRRPRLWQRDPARETHAASCSAARSNAAGLT